MTMVSRASRRKSYIIVAVLAALTAGCSSDSDLRTYIEEVKSRKSSDIEPIPQIKPYETFLYADIGRRDPFTNAPTQKGGGSALSAFVDTKRNREPLEEFPLDSLRLVGTLKIVGQQFALIKDPTAVVHRVTVGNYLGQNYGKITAIAESEVTLREIVPDGFGGYVERPATIATN